MLTADQNTKLTQVGPGTPMGDLMRRYWHPIAAGIDLNPKTPTQAVRLLGEDLTLFRMMNGKLGLLSRRCAHRGTSLVQGIPEQDGIRCCYHGWVYGADGQCIEMPNEPNQAFKDKVKIASYGVEEIGGVVFAYMGPQPAPMVPRWDLLVWENIGRRLTFTTVPANWLQCQENSLDPVHFEWLHGYYGRYMRDREHGDVEQQITDWAAGTGAWNRQFSKTHTRIGFDRFQYGIIKRRMTEGIDEEHEDWRIGHPIGFPNFVRVGAGWDHSIQWRVPIDDENTLHVRYMCHIPKPGETIEEPDKVPSEIVPIWNEDGSWVLELVPHQDHMVWISQGAITDRTTESLNTTDVGLIMFRKMLDEQIAIVQDGGDPINTFRDPAENECIVLPQEDSFFPGYGEEPGGPFKDQRPGAPEVDVKLMGS
ncbi:MAG: Rieske 2Fe-2S domain-containing protein [Dehalococcoidia bacterium]